MICLPFLDDRRCILEGLLFRQKLPNFQVDFRVSNHHLSLNKVKINLLAVHLLLIFSHLHNFFLYLHDLLLHRPLPFLNSFDLLLSNFVFATKLLHFKDMTLNK